MLHHPLTTVTHSKFIWATVAVFVLLCVHLIYGHATHILQTLPQFSQLSALHVSGRLIVTPKENRQYDNNVFLFIVLNVRHTHTHTHNVACYIRGLFGKYVPFRCKKNCVRFRIKCYCCQFYILQTIFPHIRRHY